MDYRLDQKVIATLDLEDQGQDFIQIDVLENGVIVGDNPMFVEGRMTMIGVGRLDGVEYFNFKQLKDSDFSENLYGLFIYFKNSGDPDPVPWEARTIKYPIVSKQDEAVSPNRFIKQ